jgi:hypothetical protein
MSFIDGSFANLSPGLRQIFFAGDGLTGTGSGDVQVFHVPEGATRLFLGFIDYYEPDYPGGYADNTGSIDITAEVNAPVGIGDTRPLATLSLGPVTPNPMRGQTRIRFVLPLESMVKLGVYDIRGRPVRAILGERLGAGEHLRHWDGRDSHGRRVPGGLYFIKLEISGESLTTRVVVVQ